MLEEEKKMREKMNERMLKAPTFVLVELHEIEPYVHEVRLFWRPHKPAEYIDPHTKGKGKEKEANQKQEEEEKKKKEETEKKNEDTAKDGEDKEAEEAKKKMLEEEKKMREKMNERMLKAPTFVLVELHEI